MRLPLAPLAVALVLLAAARAGAAPDLAGLGFQPHPGAALPGTAQFTDAAGRPVVLGDLLRLRPSIITLGYYHCPNLCGVVRGDLFAALRQSGLEAGQDYDVIALSIDPQERPRDAAAAKVGDMTRFPTPGADAAWHFLTGDSGAVARAVGYVARYDTQLGQFLHPVGVVVATPRGTVSSYLLGVGYTAAALRAALQRANAGFVAPAPSPLLLLCFHYDPSTGRYSFAILRALRLFALLTAATLAALLALLHVRRPAR